MKRLQARFYVSATGTVPVRDWLMTLPIDDRCVIGFDIATVEIVWPVGMPTCRAIGGGLLEVRSTLPSSRIWRVLFCIEDGEMILLHGFVKKTQNTPDADLRLARTRQKEVKS